MILFAANTLGAHPLNPELSSSRNADSGNFRPTPLLLERQRHSGPHIRRNNSHCNFWGVGGGVGGRGEGEGGSVGKRCVDSVLISGASIFVNSFLW